MNATKHPKMWEEFPEPGTRILYNCEHYPERITVLKTGGTPLHFDFPNGIGTPEIEQIRKFVLS